MAILNTVLNLVVCGLAAIYGTAAEGCEQIMQNTTSVWITPSGFEFDGTRDFDEEYITELKQEGNLIILKGIKEFTDNSSDDVYETLADQTKQLTTLGLYEFGAMFTNGVQFHIALHSLNSFGAFDVTFVDRNGNLLGCKASSGNLKGFSTNFMQGDKLTFATNAAGMKQGIKFQLAERSELDNDAAFVDVESLDGYKPQKETGINEVVVSYTTAPSDTDTTIDVKMVLKQNNKPFVGAVTTDILTTLNGSTESATWADGANPGEYTGTVTSLSTNDVVTVQLYDTVNSYAVIDKAGTQYKSNTASATVV